MASESVIGVIERRNGAELIISLSGELDVHSAPHLTDHVQLLALDAPGLAVVTVDLLSLRFLDSTGISALIELRRRTDAHQLAFRLVNVPDLQRHILEIFGLTEYLGVDDQS